MNCRKVTKMLGKYLDKELTDKRITGLIEGHLKKCAACKQELNSLILIKKLMLQKEGLPAREDFWARLKNRLKTKPAPLTVRWVSRSENLAKRLIPVPIAITILITVLLFGKTNDLNYINNYIFEDLNYEEIGMLNENYDFTSWLINNGL
ncbi:MAG: zf-HC2 domain-containing protein [Candidatus Omnitrophota bacterium]|nr:zf-HC2 domain-containing protein [Candidatus Omnitrophota bacterium]